MGLVLSVDVGTTNIKAALVDERGRIVDEATSLNMQLDGDVSGRAEHDPAKLRRALLAICRVAIGPRGGEIERRFLLGGFAVFGRKEGFLRIPHRLIGAFTLLEQIGEVIGPILGLMAQIAPQYLAQHQQAIAHQIRALDVGLDFDSRTDTVQRHC